MKKLINWPRKGLMESVLTKPLESPLLWAKKPGVTGDKNTWKRRKTCKGHGSKTPMNEPLPSRKKELQAVSREKHKVAVELLRGHTTLRAYMFRPDAHSGRIIDHSRIVDCAGKKKIVCILYIIVRHWHAKDTETWAVCSWSPRI